MFKKEKSIGAKVLRIGLESLLKDAIKGNKKELINASEVISTILQEIDEQEGITITLEKTIDDPVRSLNTLENIFEREGLKGTRQFTKKWEKADFYAVSKEALSRYSQT
jgi:hypothetical protein